MKIAVISESRVDAAAIHILVQSILGTSTKWLPSPERVLVDGQPLNRVFQLS